MAAKGVKMVNIPRSVVDEFHRYKMPEIIEKVEGRGNGIKTVLVNINAIAKALYRPAAYPTKYLGFQLGSITTIDPDNDRYIVNGKHDKAILAKHLDEFIERYVLCKTCNNPETLMVLTKGDNIELRCKACGAVTQVMSLDKMGAFILKNPPPTSEEARKAKKEQKDKKDREEEEVRKTQEEAKKLADLASKRKKKADAADDEEDWTADTSEEAVLARRRDLLGFGGAATKAMTGASPAPSSWISDLEAAAIAGDAEALRNLAKSGSRKSDGEAVKALFHKVFPETQGLHKQVVGKVPLLAPFTATEDGQGALLDCLVAATSTAPENYCKALPSVLQALYEADILSEEQCLSWWKNLTATPEKPEHLAKFITGSTPFFEWLAEEDEEDEEDN